ncbi:RlpA-like double-psi beta-barrel-protein domain-containing protein-containing protein [Cantharellus anzutake]|uniref:RlpA-like double-psi beta-barrel-protein domain-containing protein-containing protein n=1 Tax=Cantharellus anzutake TaxID=1750568 RepID=UPI0019069721|nr:RlpA-like double-psi beta-barrel-protein domain-containing protein-containing protein [Cantharellus anzutake]KAF8340644.1 RlpA-like double-psi beta-barrel-protein domain-containing protein-containing protein [Cantharellus anzutake]
MLQPSSFLLILFSFSAFVFAAPISKRGQTYSGQATYYAAGLGACGIRNTGNDFIVALNTGQWDGRSHCFKMITISHGGRTHQAQITDECPTCGYGALDLSESLFSSFEDTSAGVFQMTWWYNDNPPNNNPSPTPSPKPHTTSKAPAPTPTTTTTRTPTPTPTTTSTSSRQRSTSTTASSTGSRSRSIHTSTTPTSTSSSTSAPAPTPSNETDGNIQAVYNVLLSLGKLVGVAAGQA